MIGRRVQLIANRLIGHVEDGRVGRGPAMMMQVASSMGLLNQLAEIYPHPDDTEGWKEVLHYLAGSLLVLLLDQARSEHPDVDEDDLVLAVGLEAVAAARPLMERLEGTDTVDGDASE